MNGRGLMTLAFAILKYPQRSTRCLFMTMQKCQSTQHVDQERSRRYGEVHRLGLAAYSVSLGSVGFTIESQETVSSA
jgi:hypothetical protein